MLTYVPGHKYLLDSLDGPYAQRLVFVSRVGPTYPGNLEAFPGTTSQEVLRALIARAEYVEGQIPAWQTRTGKALMKVVIWLFEHRAARRHGRRLSLRKLPRIHEMETCKICGHVQCGGHK